MSSWIVARCHVYGWVCLLAGVLLSPIAVHLRSASGFSTPKITVLLVTTAGAVAAWLAWSLERRRWLPPSRLLFAAAGVLVVSALATAASLSPLRSLVGDHDYRGGLVSIVLYVGLFVAILGLCWEEPSRLRHLAVVAAAAAGAVAVSVVLQVAGVDRLLWSGPVPGGGRENYPPGTVGHPLPAGAYLGITAPLVAYTMLTARSWVSRWALGATGGVVLVALWETQSRSGIVALAVGAAVMAFAARDRWPRWTAAAAALGVSVAVLLFGLVALHPGTEQAPDRLAGLQVLNTRSLQYRLDVWSAAGRAVVDRPLLGSGPETFYATFPRHRSPDPRWASLSEAKAHNIFLERATETGIVTTLAYFTLVALAVLYGYRKARTSDRSVRLLTAAFLGVLSGYLAQGLFSIDWPILAALGWLALGALAVLADPVVVARRDRAPAGVVADWPGTGSARSRPRWALHVLIAAGLTMVVVVGLRPLQADVAAAAGMPHTAIRLNPLEPEHYVRAATLSGLLGQASRDESSKRQFLSDARSDYLRALRLKPGDISLMVALAELETVWGEELDPAHFELAAGWWARVAQQEPANRWRREQGSAALHAAKMRTVSRLESLSRLRVDDPSSWRRLAAAYRALGDRQGEAEALAGAKAAAGAGSDGPGQDEG